MVNEVMFENYKGIHVDEGMIVLDISDHCLVRAWFKLGTINRTNWKKPIIK